ncbi:MAG: heavy metal-responsive transcriptional regulator, partial [Bacteroidetes bacterium]
MKIGDVAKRAGVNVQTIRFYERKGLMEAPPRTASGYRQYTGEAVRRIRFIKHAQELGFSLREIHELLSLRVDPHTTCADIQQYALEKVEDIERRIASL